MTIGRKIRELRILKAINSVGFFFSSYEFFVEFRQKGSIWEIGLFGFLVLLNGYFMYYHHIYIYNIKEAIKQKEMGVDRQP
jgi:hypothetical protein